MTDKTSSGLRLYLAVVGGAVAGFALAALILVDPFGWRAAPSPSDDTAQMSESGLWTCGMHPNVIQDEPGTCPICQMNLVPLHTDGDMMADSHAGHDHGEMMGGDMIGGEMTGDEMMGDEVWTCPMHPEIVMSEPGSCPICGMDLVKKEMSAEMTDHGGHGDAGPTVSIDSAVVQNMNVRTAKVERRDLLHPIRTVGYLDYDQERMVTVTTKYSGFVEKVYVNYVGENVDKGQALFEVYSPELIQTEHELLSAHDFARSLKGAPEDARQRAEALIDAARVRLGYWDIAPEQIKKLEETREVFRTLKVVAPARGLVMKRLAGLEGMAVHPGMEIFHIADLRSLWLSVEVFEDQVAWVREGTPAEITLTYFPGKTFRGTVRYLEPEFSEATRTLKVKIEIKNPDRELRKGMFATVVFKPLAVEDAVVVPSQAILRTGERNVVVVALGEGRFAPREVVIGQEAEGMSQILSGLEEGEELVVSSQFLLDSESKLREAIQKMIAARAGKAEPAPMTTMGGQGHVH